MNEVPLLPPFPPPIALLVDLARADLSSRLSIDLSQIILVDLAEVTWPDGSLGCPKPGMLYTQVLVDGLRIRLTAGGRVYEYHSGGGRPPFLCQQA